MSETYPGWPVNQTPQVVISHIPWWKQHRNRLLLISGAVVCVLALGGVAFGLMHTGNTPPAPKQPGASSGSDQQATAAPNTPNKTTQPSKTNQPSKPSTPTAPKTNTPTASGGTQTPSSGSQSSGGTGATGTAGCTSGQIGTPPSCYPAPPAPAASGKQWKLAWNEEFNGSDYDHAKLTPCFDWNYGGCTASFNNGREAYAASQVQVSGGTAKLVAQPQNPPISDGACQNGQCTYLSGLLSTARPRADNGSAYLYTFTYGYIEGSLKLPATRGFFTAFWMLPADPSFSYNTEIDILENLGYDSQTMFMTYSYNNRAASYTPNTGVGNNGACPVTDLSGGFHKFGVDWQPTHIAWYIDGVKCGQFNGDSTTIESGPMQLILDMMVDNNWQRSWNEGLLDASLVRQLEVDYLRVYQQQ